MQPALNPIDGSRDWVLINTFRPRNLQRDDIVLFKSPSDPDVVYCKRVKGVGRDTLNVGDIYGATSTGTGTGTESDDDGSFWTTVPKGHLWVEGDNFHSIDSRNFGPISDGLVIGRVSCVIWPPSRWGTDLKKYVGRRVFVESR